MILDALNVQPDALQGRYKQHNCSLPHVQINCRDMLRSRSRQPASNSHMHTAACRHQSVQRPACMP